MLDAQLGQRLNLGNTPPAEICLAWQALRRSYGLAGIAAIAREVGWSERHLAKQFRTEIGLTPKTAGRVIRFDRARRMLWRTNGADAAARCGYADQSHFVRDFIAFAGRGPRAWLVVTGRRCGGDRRLCHVHYPCLLDVMNTMLEFKHGCKWWGPE